MPKVVSSETKRSVLKRYPHFKRDKPNLSNDQIINKLMDVFNVSLFPIQNYTIFPMKNSTFYNNNSGHRTKDMVESPTADTNNPDYNLDIKQEVDDVYYNTNNDNCTVNIKQEEMNIKEESLVMCTDLAEQLPHTTNKSSQVCTKTGNKPASPFAIKHQKRRKNYSVIHVEGNANGIFYACSVCDFKAFERRVLGGHMWIHAVEKALTCCVCEYKTSHRSTLAHHMKTHTCGPLFACSICEYRSLYKSSVVSHMQVHTAEKDFSCSVCEYKTRYKSCYINHMKSHDKIDIPSLYTSEATFNGQLVNNIKTYARKKQ